MTLELKPQYSFIRLRGKFIQGKNFFEEKLLPSGRQSAKANFGIKTSEDNLVFCEVFGVAQDKVWAFKKGESTIEIDWNKRKETELPKGYKTIVPYDTAFMVKDFNNNDDVVVIGEIDWQEYNDKFYVKNICNNIYMSDTEVNLEEIDASNEDNVFRQDFVFVDKEYDKQEKKIFVTGYVIKKVKKDEFEIRHCNFVVDVSNKDNEEVATFFMKTVKPGDTLKAEGIIHNRVIKELQEVSQGIGKQRSPKKDYVIVGEKKYLEITYVDNHVEKAYKISELEEYMNQGNFETELVNQAGEEKAPWEV